MKHSPQDPFFRRQTTTLDADTVLQHVWDVDHVRGHLSKILEGGAYDAVLTLLPTLDTHGHHKSAAILALEAVATLPAAASIASS